MTKLFQPQTQQELTDYQKIRELLSTKGVALSRWEAKFPLKDSDDQETIIKAYSHELEPFMKAHGFETADVINVHKDTANIEAIRQKFLKEHIHSEDEVRFFVDGSGHFWFHFDDGEVVRLSCTKGDFLSVPKGYRHWFDLAPEYHVKAIRIFSNQEGWVAKYTESGVDARYNP